MAGDRLSFKSFRNETDLTRLQHLLVSHSGSNEQPSLVKALRDRIASLQAARSSSAQILSGIATNAQVRAEEETQNKPPKIVEIAQALDPEHIVASLVKLELTNPKVASLKEEQDITVEEYQTSQRKRIGFPEKSLLSDEQQNLIKAAIGQGHLLADVPAEQQTEFLPADFFTATPAEVRQQIDCFIKVWQNGSFAKTQVSDLHIDPEQSSYLVNTLIKSQWEHKGQTDPMFEFIRMSTLFLQAQNESRRVQAAVEAGKDPQGFIIDHSSLPVLKAEVQDIHFIDSLADVVIPDFVNKVSSNTGQEKTDENLNHPYGVGATIYRGLNYLAGREFPDAAAIYQNKLLTAATQQAKAK